MRCSKCGAENREGRKFCAKCGSSLARLCPRCGASNEPADDFCGECGAALTTTKPGAVRSPIAAGIAESSIRIAPEQGDAALALDGERKTVTALFADIKGSMELIEDLDPEETRSVVDPALKLMMDAVHHYSGFVAQSTDDGIFALFGAPVAYEDHPQRALYAARRLQDEMRRYSATLRAVGNPPIEARVGVNTGEVVVRSITTGEGHAEYTPIGHSTSLAARMQTLAPTGSIATTDATRKFCEGYFTFEPLGPTVVKGVSEPVEVYQVTGLGPLRTRLQRSASRGYTKFVGRQCEMDAMKAAADQAKAGHGQIVAAMAEPGVGKSRLFFEFKVKNQPGWMVVEAFSVSYGKASAYLPLIDLLHSYFKITAEDDPRARREKVNGRIVTLDPALEDTRPYLFALLGLVEDDDLLVQMDAQIRRRRTLEAIKRILLRESLSQPLMVIFEDLHWIDEQTQEFLNLLGDSIGTAKILLLVNYRPEYSHQWNSKTYYTQLRLDPLGKESAEEMLSALLDGGADLALLKRLIIEKTEGNPFFMEETVQVLLDDGALARDGTALMLTRPLGELKIPPTVQAILAARIDRLPADAKDLLQTLAVIGREFPTSLIRAVVTKSDDELNRTLNDLQVGEFIYEQPAVGEVEYTFKHALTQEVAYNSVLVERRKVLHQRAGEGTEALFAEQVNEHLNELARHHSHSWNVAKAVKYLQLAGQQAAQRSAYAEAVGHLTRGLEPLRKLPDDLERARQELELQLSLAQSLRWTKPGLPEIAYALMRARDLCGQVGASGEVFAVLQGLQWHHLIRLDLEPARDLAEHLLTMAEGVGEPAKLMVAHAGLGAVLMLNASSPPPASISSKPVLASLEGSPNLPAPSTRVLVLGTCGRSVMRTRRLSGPARRLLWPRRSLHRRCLQTLYTSPLCFTCTCVYPAWHWSAARRRMQ
jgi:class 3 adenylate cyclase